VNNNTLLISYKTITQSSSITENLDTKTILPLVKEVQEMEVEPVIGSALFEKLKADIAGDVLADPYKYLVNEIIKPVIINGIMSDLPFAGNYRFTNVGTIERTSENTRNTDARELQKLSDYYKSRTKWYAGKLTDYLVKNSEQFPEYTSGNDCGEGPKDSTYDVGVYLG
jgi:hypothetical protein